MWRWRWWHRFLPAWKNENLDIKPLIFIGFMLIVLILYYIIPIYYGFYDMKQNSDNNLFEIASSQQGYFSSAQAIESGYKDSNHAYHVKRGNWIREIRGVYRLSKFPETSEGQYAIWSLWSRDRKGNIQGVYSHETALSIYDVSDIMPSKLHMTVPKSFRRGTKISEVLVLHKANLSKEDLMQKQGYLVTSPFRTILDVVTDGTLEESIIQQAVSQFRSKGMILKKQIYQIIEQHPKSARYFIDSEQKVGGA
jgi:hypothetical protein